MRHRFALTALTAGVALTGSGLGAWLALNHPLWPSALLIGFTVWGLAVAYWPRLWLLLVPAALPLLNFLPWSGWLVFEEFDILLLGVTAGGYARLAVLRCGPLARGRDAEDATFAPSARPGAPAWVGGALLLCLAVSAGFALWRGLADAGAWSFNWFDGYTAPLNSVRVFKSLGHALLLAPLIHGAMRREPERSMRLLATGVLTGLAVVSLAVLWERHAFPGLFDFSSRYRTTALFWEMHVGGAAIDAFLAMSLPFLVWALVAARRPGVWLAVAVLALLAVYAVLTTFSRGVYFAAAIPSAGLASLVVCRWIRSTRFGAPSRHAAPVGRVRSPGWKVVGSGLLAMALLTEASAVLMGGTYMGERMGVADRDFAKRLAHWRDGLALLATPAQWLFGIGLGRLPAHYAREVAGGEFSGAATWLRESGPSRPAGATQVTGYARLQGPATDPTLAGRYGLARRVELAQGRVYRVGLDLRANAEVEIAVRVCERHLLFEGACQRGRLRIGATLGEWQHHTLTLVGPSLTPGAWFAPRLGLFTLSVLQAGASVDLAEINLDVTMPGAAEAFGDFSQSLSRWFPTAQVHFLPWHIDNLYLELLIERGLFGLLLTVSALLAGLWCAMRMSAAPGRSQASSHRSAQHEGVPETAAPGRLKPSSHRSAPHEEALANCPCSLLPATLAAGMMGGLMVGALGSIMDVPRVAFLLFLLMLCAMALRRRGKPH